MDIEDLHYNFLLVIKKLISLLITNNYIGIKVLSFSLKWRMAKLYPLTAPFPDLAEL